MAKTKYKFNSSNRKITSKYNFSTEQETLLREYYGLPPEINLDVFLFQKDCERRANLLAELYRVKNPPNTNIISDVVAEEDNTL